MTLPTLRTRRLVLRPVRDHDAAALLALFGDAERMRFWGHGPLRTPDDARGYIREIREGAARGDLLQWAVAPADADDRLIGTCTLASVDPTHRRAELGVALLAEVEGAGYATEAARAAIEHAFEVLGLHRVTADVDPRNAGALALLERLGFRREGRLREHHRQAGEWQDGILFGLLRGEVDEIHEGLPMSRGGGSGAARVTRVLETAVYVEDLDRSAAFYERVLGLEVMSRASRMTSLDAGSGTVLLLFLRGGSTEGTEFPGGWIPPHDGDGRAHFAFAVRSEDLDAWRERLAAHGVEVESEVEWGRGGKSLYFRDPDGHSVELASPGVWPSY